MQPPTKYLLSGAVAGAGAIAPAGALVTLPAVPLSWPVLSAVAGLAGAGGGAYALHVLAHHPDVDPVEGRKRWATALALPVVYGFGAVAALAGVAPATSVWGPLALGAALGLPGGIGIALTARQVHADRAVEEGELLVEVESPVDPRKDHWFFRYQRPVGAALAVALAGVFAWTYVEGDPAWFMGGLALLVAVQALPDPDQRLVVYEHCLRLGNRVVPWEDLEGFELTDDELVVQGVPLQLAPLRVDRSDLDDEQRVLEVLEHNLQRRERAA